MTYSLYELLELIKHTEDGEHLYNLESMVRQKLKKYSLWDLELIFSALFFKHKWRSIKTDTLIDIALKN